MTISLFSICSTNLFKEQLHSKNSCFVRRRAAQPLWFPFQIVSSRAFVSRCHFRVFPFLCAFHWGRFWHTFPLFWHHFSEPRSWIDFHSFGDGFWFHSWHVFTLQKIIFWCFHVIFGCLLLMSFGIDFGSILESFWFHFQSFLMFLLLSIFIRLSGYHFTRILPELAPPELAPKSDPWVPRCAEEILFCSFSHNVISTYFKMTPRSKFVSK